MQSISLRRPIPSASARVLVLAFSFTAVLAVFALLRATSEDRVAVCERTDQIRDAIVAQIDSVDDCAQVTSEQLAQIDHLDLSNRGIRLLRTGDFNGLSGVQTLWLNDNGLFGIPYDAFDDLTELRELHLDGNQLPYQTDDPEALAELFVGAWRNNGSADRPAAAPVAPVAPPGGGFRDPETLEPLPGLPEPILAFLEPLPTEERYIPERHGTLPSCGPYPPVNVRVTPDRLIGEGGIVVHHYAVGGCYGRTLIYPTWQPDANMVCTVIINEPARQSDNQDAEEPDELGLAYARTGDCDWIQTVTMQTRRDPNLPVPSAAGENDE